MNIAPLCPSWPARFALLVVFALTCRSFAFEDWRAISPDELKMTSDPQAPGAPAIILWRQVDRDDNIGQYPPAHKLRPTPLPRRTIIFESSAFGHHSLDQHAAHALERLLQHLHAAGKGDSHVAGRSETRAGHDRDAAFRQ